MQSKVHMRAFGIWARRSSDPCQARTHEHQAMTCGATQECSDMDSGNEQTAVGYLDLI